MVDISVLFSVISVLMLIVLVVEAIEDSVVAPEVMAVDERVSVRASDDVEELVWAEELLLLSTFVVKVSDV